MDEISKILKAIPLVIFTLFAEGALGNSTAEQIDVMTSFTCSTNAECKRKCEALGRDHYWTPNPGGSTHGTCRKRLAIAPPSRETLEMLNVVSANSDAIEEGLNDLLSRSPKLRELGVSGGKLGSFSIIMKSQSNPDEQICASCRNSSLGPTIEFCCPLSNPNCFNRCWDGVIITDRDFWRFSVSIIDKSWPVARPKNERLYHGT